MPSKHSQTRNEKNKENGEAAGWITNFSISVLFFIHSRSRHKRDAATIRWVGLNFFTYSWTRNANNDYELTAWIIDIEMYFTECLNPESIYIHSFELLSKCTSRVNTLPPLTSRNYRFEACVFRMSASETHYIIRKSIFNRTISESIGFRLEPTNMFGKLEKKKTK